MRSPIKWKSVIIFAVCLILAGCGTFEIGIENNVLPGTQTVIPVETPEQTQDGSGDIDSPKPSATPQLSEEQLIAAAVAQQIGKPVEELEIVVTDITGLHAYGFVDNGYFLAAKQGDTWQYVHAGQTNPACKDIEPYDFPLTMVSECMDENNQLVVLSGSSGGDIGDALSEYFGRARDELDFTIVEDTGSYMVGGLPGGYFLAAKVAGSWQIVFDGNGTPYCAVFELHDFPVSMVPECVDANNNLVYRKDTGKDSHGLQTLECGAGSPGSVQGSVEYVACNIQDALRSRNISALLGYLEDPFLIGYWLSEGVFYSPEDFLTLLPQLYNFNDPDYTPRLTFTTDRSQFPALDSRPVEDRFDPDVNIVEVIFSRGWGPEGDQEVLIFLSQDSDGEYKWYSMLTGDLDVPMPAPVP